MKIKDLTMSKPLKTKTEPRRWPWVGSPKFTGKKVHVLSGAMYGLVVSMLAKAGFERAEGISDADLVVFVGGTDINPSLYGQKGGEHTKYWDTDRDVFEESVYRQCVREGIPMFGICRGMQFLAAMNGAELWQDVNNHAGPSHDIYDIEEDCVVKATSLHHQMVKFNEDMDLLAVTNEKVATAFKDENLFINTERDDPNGRIKEGVDYAIEVEACIFPKTKCFLVQGHPECGCDEYVGWTLHKLGDFLNEYGKSITNDPAPELAETAEQMIG